MDDDHQDGPFTVWQMFNAPTVALFKNLELAADGLERLLMSILKSTGDFSEVLVPRPGVSKYPETYYKAFNTWLIGHLFYVWSVKNLSRIHESSKAAQLKILHFLSINGASFYNELHTEYVLVLIKLVNYYKLNGEKTQTSSEIIKHFAPDRVEIPNVQLDLEPIFVHLTDVADCSYLIELTLQLLSESIPLHTLATDLYDRQYKPVFKEALYVLEYFSIKLKLVTLKFFADLIVNYDKLGLTKFCYKFYKEIDELIISVEAIVFSMHGDDEHGDIYNDYLSDFNETVTRLLKATGYYTKDHSQDVLISICSAVLTSWKNEVFSSEFKTCCIELCQELELPEDVISVRRLNGKELELLSQNYVNRILPLLKNGNSKETLNLLKDNFCYKHLLETMNSIQFVEDIDTDFCLINFYIERCRAVFKILVTLKMEYEKWCRQRNHMNSYSEILSIMPSQNVVFVLRSITKLYEIHYSKLLNNKSCIESIMDIVLAATVVTNGIINNEINLILQLTCFQTKQHFSLQDLNFDDDFKVLILKYLLLNNLVLKKKFDDKWNKCVSYLVNSLAKNKTSDMYVNIINLSPLLLLNKVFNAGKLIGDHLIGAFLKVSPDIQKALCAKLPILACIALGSFAITQTEHGEAITGDTIFSNGTMNVSSVCSKCHNTDNTKTSDQFMSNFITEHHILYKDNQDLANNDTFVTALRGLFAKFLNIKMYPNIEDNDFLRVIQNFSNHSIFNSTTTSDVFNKESTRNVLTAMRPFVTNIMSDKEIDDKQKEAMLNICINTLVHATKSSLETSDYSSQTYTVDCIKEFGLSQHAEVLLPSTKLLIYFIMHPQSSLSPKAVVYLREICEAHKSTPNLVYHRYKKDYCRLFVDCSLLNGKHFAVSLLKVVRAFGFIGYRDFISKDVHHFLPYLIPFAVKIREVPSMIEEIASLVQCSASDFLSERFPHVYTHVYLYESEPVAKKSFDLIEKITGLSILSLIKRHFRVILTEFLLQYYCNPEKVLKACRYLASHDPDSSNPTVNANMSLTQIADFLQPKFLGVLAYFDYKLVNVKVAMSVKRKALQSFPDIMKLMGSKYLTPLRYKVLATLRSAQSLAKDYPKILALAWSGFIHNIDSISLGPLLSNLAVSLLQQMEYAPNEINKIFQYLILSNENLLSGHISDLFFLVDSKIAEKVKIVIRRHVRRTQPEAFLEKVKWYLQHLNQDIPDVKAYAYKCLDIMLKENRSEVHRAIFGGKNIDSVIVELIDSLLIGCKDSSQQVSVASGACLGQLGAIEASHLPRQYVQPDRSPFAFTLNDDCFAVTALLELTRAFQYEKDTMNMDCYALTIQEILKLYSISPGGSKQHIWDSFPEHVHQIMLPLLSSRYTLAFPSQPKKVHPLFGSSHATTFVEWAYNWAGQLTPLVESESIRELLRTVHPSMRRDVRTLLLFLPYVLLHAIMSKKNSQYIQEELLSVIGLENFENRSGGVSDKSRYRILRHIRMTPSISSTLTEEGNQGKCSKMVYVLLDFLNRWLLEWCHSKQTPMLNENYKTIQAFMEKFDKLAIARGNFLCGELERALQYLERHMDECRDQVQDQLPFLAEIYALLSEPDAVAGILTIKRSEPSLKELILAQVVTGRLQDAALCYERLAQEGQLDRHSLQGMVDCYLSLDQPFTAYRLLNEQELEADSMSELAAESLWRLGRFEQLEKLTQKPIPQSRENWGLLMGRILLSFRSQDRERFETSWREGMVRLLTQMDGEGTGESGLRSGYQNVLGMHIITEARHVEDIFHRLKALPDGDRQCGDMLGGLLGAWRQRTCLVQSDERTLEPLLRCRRILLQQAQELLEPSHAQTSTVLKSHIGDLWLQSAKLARKAGSFQQAYIYILNAEEYHPQQLFLEKAKMYWARGQQESAFTTLRRGLDEMQPQTQEQKKISAKAKLLIATYNDETTSVDVDVNLGFYKDAVDACRQWEKSLVALGAYYEKVSSSDKQTNNLVWSRRLHALNNYGKALQYGHKYLYQSMPRMLSIWLDVEVTASDSNSLTILGQMTEIIRTYSERLPLYLYLTAFSQIVSRICHPVKEVYLQLKDIIVRLILAYPQHTLWMMMCVIKSSYPQRQRRCQEVFMDPRLKEPHILKLVYDFTQLAEKLIELCNKPIGTNAATTSVNTLVRALPRLLSSDNFSHVMMPFEQFCKIILPSKAARDDNTGFSIPAEPPVYIAGIEDKISILPSLQKPRKVTLRGSDGNPYIIMLKPNDDLRKDFRLMEFNAVVNRFLQDAPETRRRRLYIRTYSVLPLNEECGLIQWVNNLVGLRPILMHIYKQKGIHTSNRELKEMMCANKDPVEKKRSIYEDQLMPRHPPVFQEWFRRLFSDPYGWYQARSAYIRTTAVMSMVGYILGLGDRHGENISFDSTNGDTVHVDFNCLFNKGEEFNWPERVPFRLTHNMEAAMGPLGHEGTYRKCCEAVMRALRAQTPALMSVVGPFVYDPLVAWVRGRAPADCGERTNEQALAHLLHIRQRLNGMVRTKNKQLSLSLSPEGQVEHLIAEATSVHNLCQMYIGWGPFL